MICRDAAEVISRSLDAPVSPAERIGLAVHTLFCGPCRRFRAQLTQLHAECQADAEGEALSDTGLSPDARERIAAALGRLPPV